MDKPDTREINELRNAVGNAWEAMKQIHDNPSIKEDKRNDAWNTFDKLIGEYKNELDQN